MRTRANNDHIAVERRPLALDAHEPPPLEVESQVVPVAVSERLEDADPELDRRMDDRRLRDCALLVG